MKIDLALLEQKVDEHFNKQSKAVEKIRNDQQAIRLYTSIELKRIHIKEKIADIIELYSCFVLNNPD